MTKSELIERIKKAKSVWEMTFISIEDMDEDVIKVVYSKINEFNGKDLQDLLYHIVIVFGKYANDDMLKDVVRLADKENLYELSLWALVNKNAKSEVVKAVYSRINEFEEKELGIIYKRLAANAYTNADILKGIVEKSIKYNLRPPILYALINPNADENVFNEAYSKIEDLKGEEFILMEESASYSSSFENAMTEQQLPLNAFLKLQNAEKACSLVQKGQFLSVLPFYVVSEAVQNRNVVLLNIPDFSYEENVYLLMHHAKVPTPQIEGFLEIFRNALT